MQATSKVQQGIEATFDRIDENADRIIEIEEFARLMLEIDHRCTATELRACFDAIDLDLDGRVTLGEFRAWQSRRSGLANDTREGADEMPDSRE